MVGPPSSAGDTSSPIDHESTVPARPTTRRKFLAALASTGVGVSLAGCGRAGTPSTPGEGSSEQSAAPAADTDVAAGPPPSLSGPWPQMRADAGNTGAVEAPAPTSDPSVRWETTAAGTVGAAVGVLGTTGPTALSQPDAGTDSESGVYVVAEDGRAAAVGADSDIRWRTAVREGCFPPAAASDRVIVPTRDRLVILDAETGEVRRRIGVSGGIFYAPVIRGDRAFVGTYSGGAVAIDLASGEERWRVGGPSRTYPPAVVDGVAYVAARRWNDSESDAEGGEDTGAFFAVDVQTGEQRWEQPLEGHPTAPPGYHTGVVYTGTHGGVVHAFDAASGDERWQESVGEWVTRGPTVAADGVYVVLLNEGPIKLALDGSVEWRATQTERNVAIGTNPNLTDEAALFGGSDGVVAFARDDGAVQWREPTPGPVQFDIRVSGDTAFAGDQYGSVVAVDVASGEQRWELPFQPPTMPGPVVGSKTVAGASQRAGTYALRATDGLELGSLGGVDVTSLTPAFLEDESEMRRETVLIAGTGGSFSRVQTIDYGEAPPTDLPPTPTPTATPEPGEPTATPTPHIDFPQPEPRWESAPDVDPRSPITYADGWAYVGTDEGVAAVDARTGALRLRHGLDGSVLGAPAVLDGRVFVVTLAGRLVALSVDEASGNGSVASAASLWKKSLAAGVQAGPAVDGGGIVVADESGVVRGFSTDGERQWMQSLGGTVHGGAAITDGRVFAGTRAGEVISLSRDDGAVEWRAPTAGAVHASPAIGLEASSGAEGITGTVFVGDHSGTLSAFDAATGDVQWRLSLGRWANAPPALGYGALFIADGTGRVYAVVGE